MVISRIPRIVMLRFTDTRCYRHVVGVIVLALFIAPQAVVAEASMPQVGVLTAGLTFDPVFAGLQEGLASLGYHEGRNISFTVARAQSR
jgi:hypothetical protein